MGLAFRPWEDPHRMKAPKRSEQFKDCTSCHYDGMAKIDTNQLIKCHMCLTDPSRPGWASKVLTARVINAKLRRPYGLPLEGGEQN
jgi:hypothetical protein